MDEQKASRSTEPTPAQTSEFFTELFKGLGAHFEREKKFEVAYANNFHFEPSVWDLKIMFGQLEQHTGTSVIDWHTAITIPWLQVKFVAYYLRVQAAWQEQHSGPIKGPAFVMPSQPKPPAGELANDPAAIAFYEAQKKIYAEMFGS
jgi:hypothetical protein